MKYMLLVSMSRERWENMATWAPEETKSVVGYMNELMKELTESGEFLGGEGLGGPARMHVVRAQAGGEPLVTDGPMAEAKEFLAGYMAIDVASVDRAIEIAKRWATCPTPGGDYAPIEVHPIMSEGPDDPELLAPYKK
jgi:hypothetical protein